MGTLSIGRLWHQESSHHHLRILMIGILFTAPNLAQLQRNTASKNPWRRQSPLPADEELAPLHIWRRQSDDDSAAASPPADDASAATSDLTPAKPAENEINVGGNAVGRQGPAPTGDCYFCIRSPGTDCLDKAPDPATSPITACYLPIGTSKPGDVRCVILLLEMRGTRDKAKSKLTEAQKMDRRVEARTCMDGRFLGPGTGFFRQGIEDPVLQHLNLKLEDGKCFKGTYLLEDLGLFRSFAALPVTFYSLEDDESTKPEPGKPKSKDPADYGLFYGEYGRMQYADLTICSCKGEKCNKETMSQLKSAGEASPAARLLRLLPA